MIKTVIQDSQHLSPRATNTSNIVSFLGNYFLTFKNKYHFLYMGVPHLVMILKGSKLLFVPTQDINHTFWHTF